MQQNHDNKLKHERYQNSYGEKNQSLAYWQGIRIYR